MRSFPHLDAICDTVCRLPKMQLWIFGSALSNETPRDIDLLLIYDRLVDAQEVRMADWWEDYEPPIDLISMTMEEEAEYRFIEVTRAERLV